MYDFFFLICSRPSWLEISSCRLLQWRWLELETSLWLKCCLKSLRTWLEVRERYLEIVVYSKLRNTRIQVYVHKAPYLMD